MYARIISCIRWKINVGDTEISHTGIERQLFTIVHERDSSEA